MDVTNISKEGATFTCERRPHDQTGLFNYRTTVRGFCTRRFPTHPALYWYMTGPLHNNDIGDKGTDIMTKTKIV
jgi:hypothetical protein